MAVTARYSLSSLGIKHKLYLALSSIASLTVILGLVSWHAFGISGDSLQQITRNRIPALSTGSRITVDATKFSALAPQLLFVHDKDALESLYKDLLANLAEERRLAGELKNYGAVYEETSERIEKESFDMETQLLSFKQPMIDALAINAQQKQQVDSIEKLHLDFIATMSPIFDDTYFDLLTELDKQSKTAIAPQALNHIKTQIKMLASLREIKSGDNLLVGILGTVVNYQEIEGIPVLRDRFRTTLRDMDKRTTYLLSIDKKKFAPLRENFEAMETFDSARNNAFDSQEDSLRKIMELQLFLKKIETSTNQMDSLVKDMSEKITGKIRDITQVTSEQLSSGRITIIVVLGVSIFIAFLISWLYVRKRIVQRIENLESVMLSIADNDFSVEIKSEGTDEISKMAKSLFFFRSKMIENKVLVNRLTESNTELERFAYVASHDMQEPIRMMVNFGKLLTEEHSAALGEDGSEYLRLVTDSASRMQAMVSDLLEYARVDKESARVSVFNTNTELDHVLANLSSAISESKARIISENLPEIKGNPVQFMRLLQNLIGNGMKYQKNEDVPHITVGVRERGEFWEFSIRDNGIGMEEKDADVIFEPFKRLHTWDEYKGTGIGLSLCKKIVENHGGTIWVKSAKGAGSTFHFTWPKD